MSWLECKSTALAAARTGGLARSCVIFTGYGPTWMMKLALSARVTLRSGQKKRRSPALVPPPGGQPSSSTAR